MKSLARWTLDSVAALSLLLAVALLAIWISHGLPRPFRLSLSARPVNTPRETIGFVTSINMIVIEHAQWEKTPAIGPIVSDRAACDAFRKQFAAETFDISVLRFKTRTGPIFAAGADGRYRMMGTGATYLVPLGLLIFVFAMLPAWRWLPPLFRWTKSRFIVPPGCCKNCGYDLRATPDRCPECGAIPLKAAIQS